MNNKSPDYPTVSVIIPCYNQVDTVKNMIHYTIRIEGITEIILVDDVSTDGTIDVLKEIEAENHDNLRIIYHDKHYGRGITVTTGMKESTGEIIAIQDADFEYDPRDCEMLIKPIQEGITSVVYGSRFLGGPRKAMTF